MVLKKWHEVVNVVDTRVYLFKVAQAELFLFKLYYYVYIFFGELTVTVGVFVQLFYNLLKV